MAGLLVMLLVATSHVAAEDAVSPPPADPPAVSAPISQETATADLVRRVQPSVAVLSFTDRDGEAMGVGSGVVIREDGLIATNLHVLGEARPVKVELLDGRKFDVQEVYAHEKSQDLALVKIDAKDLPALELGNSDELQPGQWIVALGNPQGLTHSVVTGVVSALREDVNGMSMIQLAVPIERGNSGGPVVDSEGRVVGLLTLKSLVTDNLGYAVTVNSLKPLLEKPNPIPMAKWLTIGVLNPKHWTVLGKARWTQHAGRVRADGIGDPVGGRSLCLSTTAPPAETFEAAISVKITQADGAAGIVFHSDGNERHYGFYPSSGKLRVARFDGPAVFDWHVLWDEQRPEYRPGDWNELKIRVESDRIVCFCNGKEVYELRDDLYRSGKVGLAKFRHTTAEFKGFRVADRIETPQLDDATRTALESVIARAEAEKPVTAEAVNSLKPLGEIARIATIQKAEELEHKATWLRQLAVSAYEAEVRDRLVAALSSPTGEPDLLKAALLVAALDEQELNVDFYIQEVDDLAKELKTRFRDEMTDQERLAELNRLVFEDHGFHGSRTNYYSASNSHLNEVIDDREGLPITLSVLYIEIGRRAGLDIEGVGLPGHFIVRFVPSEGESQLIDVYNGGKVLTREQALMSVFAEGQTWDESVLEAVTARQIIVRMLRNLLGPVRPQDDPQRALRYVNAVLAVDEDSVADHLFRAVLFYETERFDEGLADVEWVTSRNPEGVDLSRVEQLRNALQQRKDVAK